MTTHKTGTREQWLAARLDLLEAEKDADAAKRRTGTAAPGAALGSCRQGLSVRHRRRGASLADLFQGRSQLLVYHFMFGPDYTAGCTVLLGDRRRLQRHRRAPRQPRRDALGRLARAAGEAAGVQAADGLDLPLGVLLRQRLQLRLQRLVHRRAAARRRHRIQLPARAGQARPRRATPRCRAQPDGRESPPCVAPTPPPTCASGRA